MNRNAEWADAPGGLAIYYDRWRHGGWYVTFSDGARYPSGACGCVTRNIMTRGADGEWRCDGRWRIACDERPDAAERFSYPSRKAAALAERALMLAEREALAVV